MFDDIIIDALLEAGIVAAPNHGDGPLYYGMVIEACRAEQVTRLLNIHGWETKPEKLLETALTNLASKYKLDEFMRFENDEETKVPVERKIEDLVGRKKIVGFIQRKIRETRAARNKKRAQHARDEMTGKVRAYEEILRRVKAIK